METIDYLLEYERYLHISGFLWNILRWIGWGIILVLKSLLEGLEKISSSVFKLVDFFSYSAVKQFIQDNLFLTYAIATVFLVVFFLRYMSNRNSSMKSLLNNLLLFVGVILMCISVTTTITSKVFGVAKAINQEDTTVAATIINENIYDITSIDANDWNGADKVRHVSYDSSQYTFFNITKTIDPGKYEFSSDKSKEILSNRVDLNSQGEYELVKLDSGMFTIDKEYYYRYSWSFWTIFFTLLMTIFVTLFTAFKYLQSLYNIGYNGVIMPFFAGTDFVGGNKIKKIMLSTMNIWVNVILFAVSLKVYRLFVGYLSEADINSVSKLVFQLLLTVFLFEGPWIIQELTGIDGGLKSSVGQAMALGGAMFYGGKGAKALAGKAKDLGGKVKHASKFMAGLADGAIDMDSLKKKIQLKDTKPSENQMKPDIPTLSEEEKEAFAKEIKENQEENTNSTEPSRGEEAASPGKESGVNLESGESMEQERRADLNKEANSKENPEKVVADSLTKGETENPDNLKSHIAQKPIDAHRDKEIGGASPSLKEHVQDTENANESYADVLKQGSHSKLSSKPMPNRPIPSLMERMSTNPTRINPNQSKRFSSITLPNSVLQAKNHMRMNQQAANVLSQMPLKEVLPSSPLNARSSIGKQANSALTANYGRIPLKATPPQMIAAKQTLSKAAMTGSVLQRPSVSRQVIAGHILGSKHSASPVVQVPASISQSSAVQTLKQDIERNNAPLTDKTVFDVVVDRQINKAEKKWKKEKPYAVTKEIGKNTGEALRSKVESNSLRRFFSSSKQNKE